MALPTKAKAIIRDGLKPLTRKVEHGQIIVHYRIVRMGGATGAPLALFGKKFANSSGTKFDEIYKDDAQYVAAKGKGLQLRGAIKLEAEGALTIIPSAKDNRVLAAREVVRHFKALKEVLAKEQGVDVSALLQRVLLATPGPAADVSTLKSSAENEEEVEVAPTVEPTGPRATDPTTLELAQEGETSVEQIKASIASIPTLDPSAYEGLRYNLDIAFDGLAELKTRIVRHKRSLSGLVTSSKNAANIQLLDRTLATLHDVEERIVSAMELLEADEVDEDGLSLQVEADARVKEAEAKQLRLDFNALVKRIDIFIGGELPVEKKPRDDWTAEGGRLLAELAKLVDRAEKLYKTLNDKHFARSRVGDSISMTDEVLARASLEGRALTRRLGTTSDGPPLPTEEDWTEALRAASPLIERASKLTDIGGVTVKRKADAAMAAAAKKRWLNALTLLDGASMDAALVVEREVYVRAYNAHRYRIKAAMEVKAFVKGTSGETHGGVVKKRWDEAQKLAKPGSFSQAAVGIEALAKHVRDVIDPALEEARLALAREKEALAEQRKQIMDGLGEPPSTTDLKKLEDLVNAELARAKREKEAGVDPTEEMMTPLTDPTQTANARALFVRFDWFQLKEKLHSGEHTEALHKQLWRFRQDYVTRQIDTLRGSFPELIAKASGSTDLESDIDITFATPAAGDDVEAAKRFNAEVKKDFKKPPGRTFDVNIYIREYGTIKESFNEFHEPTAVKDQNLEPQDDPELAKLTTIDQDVATLLKQRRFKTDREFELLLQSVLNSYDPVKQKDERAEVQQRYEEAEANYFITLKDKIDKIEQSLRKALTTAVDEPAQRITEALAEIEKLRKIKDVYKGQRAMQELIATLERRFPAETMEVTDEMYLERMGTLRANEARIRALEGPLHDANAEHEGKTCAAEHADMDHAAWRKAKIATLKVSVKKDITTNIVFANEAYISEGAIEHVVMTGQGGLSQEEKTKKIRAMPTSKLLQSANEQLADFFKEMEKYIADTVTAFRSKDETRTRRVQGEAYVHASKYVSRLLDAAIALALKYEDDETDPFTLEWLEEIPKPRGEKVSEILSALKADIDEQLLAMRKSSSLSASVKAEVAVARLEALLEVTDVGEFSNLFELLGKEINSKVRARTDFREAQAVEKAKEVEFFQLAERPLKERALGSLKGVVSSRKVDRLGDLTRALTDLEVEGGDAIGLAWVNLEREVSTLKEEKSAVRLGTTRRGMTDFGVFVKELATVDTEIHRVFTDHLEVVETEVGDVELGGLVV